MSLKDLIGRLMKEDFGKSQFYDECTGNFELLHF